MTTPEALEDIRTARRAKSAARLVVLRSEVSSLVGFQGWTVRLDGMRSYLAGGPGYPRLFLVPVGKGFALFLRISHGPRVWLIAERSKQVRVFKRLETALAACKSMNAPSVVVMLDQHVAEKSDHRLDNS